MATENTITNLPLINVDDSQRIINAINKNDHGLRYDPENSIKSLIEKMEGWFLGVNDELVHIGNMIADSFENLSEIIEEVNFRDKLLEDREREKGINVDTSESTQGNDTLIDPKTIKNFGILGGLLSGAFIAYFLDIDKYIRTAVLPKAMLAIGKTYSALIKQSFIGTEMIKGIKNLSSLISGKFINVISLITKSFKGTQAGLISFSKASTALLNIFSFIAKSIGGVVKTVTAMVAPLTKLFGFFKTIPVIGQVLTAIFGIFDFITGFIDGFKEAEGGILSKLFGGFTEGMIKAIKGILLIPLDMLKNGFAWLLEQVGAESLADSLRDSFSFVELFDSFIEKIKSLISFVLDIPKNINYNLFDSILTKIKNIVTSITDYLGEKFGIIADILGIDLKRTEMSAEEYSMMNENKMRMRDEIKQKELDKIRNSDLNEEQKIEAYKNIDAAVNKKLSAIDSREFVKSEDKILNNVSSNTRDSGISDKSSNIEKNNDAIRKEEKQQIVMAPINTISDNSVKTNTIVNNTNYSSNVKPRSEEHTLNRLNFNAIK